MTALLATFHTMSLAKYNDTRVKFATFFFETLRQLNQHINPKDHLSYDNVRSLLLLTVTSDRNMVDQFQGTGSYVADIAALKSNILNKASLYDGKDNQAKPGTNSGTTNISWRMMMKLSIMLNNTQRIDTNLPTMKLPRTSPSVRTLVLHPVDASRIMHGAS